MSHKDGDQRRQMEAWQPTNQSLEGGPQPTMVRPMEEGAALSCYNLLSEPCKYNIGGQRDQLATSKQ